MDEIQYFNNIKIDIPYNAILYRLGYKNRKTQLNKFEKKKIDIFIKEGFDLCEKKMVYRIYKKFLVAENKIKLSKNAIIKSKDIYNLLKNSSELVLMAATVGKKIIESRDFEIKQGNAAKAIIFDAVASEVVDSLLDWFEKYFGTQIRRENKFLTRRFSPGYGDLKLETQKIFYSLLNLKKLNVKITKKFILLPEKTVTAISGIEKI
jgi:hypothetical protein